MNYNWSKEFLKMLVSAIIFIVLALSLWNGIINRQVSFFIKEGFEDGIDTPDVNTPDVDTPDVNTPDVNTPDVNTPDVDTTDAIPYTDSSAKLDAKSDKSATQPATQPVTQPATLPATASTLLTPSATASKPATEEDDADLDITIENATKLTDLFNKVNTQMDVIRTLKLPYSDKITELKYLSDDTLSADTIVQTNLLHILRNGIKPNDDDIKSNPGLKKFYPYGGMTAIIDKLIQSLSLQCTTVTDINKCYRVSNQKNIIRIENIVNTHQSILDKIMEKQ